MGKRHGTKPSPMVSKGENKMSSQRLTLRFEEGRNRKKMVVISVDFQGIPPAELALIADRLQGNDVHKIWVGNAGTHQMRELISAKGDTYADLIDAIRDNQKE